MKDSDKTIKLKRGLGELIRKYRLKLELSQEELAEKADIHRTYVSDIELGKVDISVTVANRIARGLGISLSLLIKETEKVAP